MCPVGVAALFAIVMRRAVVHHVSGWLETQVHAVVQIAGASRMKKPASISILPGGLIRLGAGRKAMTISGSGAAISCAVCFSSA